MCELRRVPCSNSSGHPTSIFSFVRCECEQLIPRCVSDAFSKAVVLYQATNVQVFQKDHPKSGHQLSTFLRHKVVPAKPECDQRQSQSRWLCIPLLSEESQPSALPLSPICVVSTWRLYFTHPDQVVGEQICRVRA